MSNTNKLSKKLRNRYKNHIKGKSGFARILAAENVSIVHDPKATTASFDLKNRVINLPILKNMKGYTYNAFVAHEVAHAIWTPSDEYIQAAKDIHPTVVNVVEDARIEKLMQRKFPGTKAYFNSFYRDTVKDEIDFFEIKDLSEDQVNSLNLCAKVNLYFKCGRFMKQKLRFNAEEQRILDMCKKLETFDEVIEASKELLKYCEDNDQVVPIDGDLTYGEGDSVEGKEGEGGDGKNGSKPIKGKYKLVNANGVSDDVGSQETFDKNFGDKAIDKSGDSSFANIPTFAPIDVASVCDKVIDIPVSDGNYAGYNSFMTKAMPLVNQMASVFQRKKSAKEYQRRRENKMGMIDSKKLSMYATHEDIFLTSEAVFEAKNHGFVMFIDWSGSMSQNIFSTYKQLLILSEFCRKIQVPFEVYGFTSSFSNSKRVSPAGGYNRNDFVVTNGSDVCFKLLDSTLKLNDFKRATKDIFRHLESGSVDTIHGMGGTPLNSVAVLSKPIIEGFRNKTGVEKVSMFLLSDGGATDDISSGLHYNYGRKRMYARDTTTGINYEVSGDNNIKFHGFFNIAKEMLNVDNMTGFFLTDSLDSSEISMISPESRNHEHSEKKSKFASSGYVEFKNDYAFDSYYAININQFDAASMKRNMIFLNKFIENIS